MHCTDAVLPAPAPPAPTSRPRTRPRSPFTAAEEPAWLWRGTIPSLDGLRALSIALVILAHLAVRLDPSRPFARLHRIGALGVEMFFVISGFLITLLLLREQRRSHTVS